MIYVFPIHLTIKDDEVMAFCIGLVDSLEEETCVLEHGLGILGVGLWGKLDQL